MSISAMPMAVRAVSEPGGMAEKLRRPPAKRQAIAIRDATMRPEPR